MKKSMKAKRPAQPASHPPVLAAQPELPKPSGQMPERHRQAGRKGQKGGR